MATWPWALGGSLSYFVKWDNNFTCLLEVFWWLNKIIQKKWTAINITDYCYQQALWKLTRPPGGCLGSWEYGGGGRPLGYGHLLGKPPGFSTRTCDCWRLPSNVVMWGYTSTLSRTKVHGLLPPSCFLPLLSMFTGILQWFIPKWALATSNFRNNSAKHFLLHFNLIFTMFECLISTRWTRKLMPENTWSF